MALYLSRFSLMRARGRYDVKGINGWKDRFKGWGGVKALSNAKEKHSYPVSQTRNLSVLLFSSIFPQSLIHY